MRREEFESDTSTARAVPWRRIASIFAAMMAALALWLFRSQGGDADEPLVEEARRPTPVLAPSDLAPGAPEPPAIESLPSDPFPYPPGYSAAALMNQTDEQVHLKSYGCIACHQGVGDMHDSPNVKMGCVDCHGGDPCATTKAAAHVHPRFPEAWTSSANPQRSYTLLNHESPEFIRFVNPGDLRIAHISCGACHGGEVLAVKKSMMTHGCMLWGAALYNNGAYPLKNARFGESYSMFGSPQRLQTVPPPTKEEMEKKGVLPYLDPMPRFEVSQPGNVLRIFERGGRFRPEVGIPEPAEQPGRPRTRLSNRGLGTENRTDPTVLGLQKTRLLDPTLNFLGTNDHPGDYRSSGCTACHVIYANDRSLVNSGPYAKFGNRGTTVSPDPTIPKHEPGHPIMHRFAPANAIPTSQCIICHIHPGTTVMNSFTGFQWWDEETDGELMYPAQQRYPTSQEAVQMHMLNPDEAAQQGLWSDPEFLANVTNLNTRTRHTQFADFHGHGWVFRAVFKKDRKGHLLDHRGLPVEAITNEALQSAVAMPVFVKDRHKDPAAFGHNEHPETATEPDIRDGVPVHLVDIHLEKGMHCIDCHFTQDVHGDTKLYREVRAAVEIQCSDCHGTATERAQLATTGPASTFDPEKGIPGRNLATMTTPSGRRRFEVEGNKIYQNSMVEQNLRWEVKQTIDTIDPAHPHYNPRSHHAKTVRWPRTEGAAVASAGDQTPKMEWGGTPGDGTGGTYKPEWCAHRNEKMSCIACHSSWNPSCFGCHLPQKANKKVPSLHNEGDVSRNMVSYNFQTLRDDVFMLAHDGDVTNNRIGPARSSCAIHVGSYNNNRESIYVQQQTISSDGLSGIAFSTNVPHTVRGGSNLPQTDENLKNYAAGTNETKMCSDCHVSKNDDNNAVMAQLLMHGTNYTNFVGRYCWVSEGEHGFAAVMVTERDEPQTVIGSSMHKLAFPDNYERHLRHDRELQHVHHHHGKDISESLLQPFKHNNIQSLLARGEYLYAACGEGGLRVFDIAFIDDKAFSERIISAPVSPFGQQFYVKTKYATAVAAPTTIAPDPTRKQFPENQEPAVAGIYGFIYVTDKHEGLILVGAGTLLDGNPLNNFLKRDVTFNPDGILNGAKTITIVGNYAYIGCDVGLVVVSLEDPKCPHVTAVVGEEHLHDVHSIQVQFRYAFVCDHEGVKVLDVTKLDDPQPVMDHGHIVTVPIAEAHSIYVARTYAYVAGGHEGLIILDVTNPEKPIVDQVFTAGGCINDLHDVKLGITYVSEFAYLADGCNGLRVVQLTSPETPGNDGFSPRPTPRLIATYPMQRGHHVVAVSEGVDRDRAVDESGNQIAVFGRIGAKPLTLAEQRKMYLYTPPTDDNGKAPKPTGNEQPLLYKVSDYPYDESVYQFPERVLDTLLETWHKKNEPPLKAELRSD